MKKATAHPKPSSAQTAGSGSGADKSCETNMGLSTKGPITPWRGSWAHKQLVSRNCRIMNIDPQDAEDQRIEDAIALADLRETARYGEIRNFRFA